MKTLAKTILSLVALTLAGCAAMPGSSNKFACPMTDGVTCMGVRDVYAATEDSDHVTGIGAPEGKAAPSSDVRIDERAGTHDAPQHGVVLEADSLALVETSAPVSSLPSVRTGSEPFRTPAKLLRIYIAPWEDEQGDLHLGGFVFTEIEARRWRVASPAPQTETMFQLLDVPQQQNSQEAKPGGNAGAGNEG